MEPQSWGRDSSFSRQEIRGTYAFIFTSRTCSGCLELVGYEHLIYSNSDLERKVFEATILSLSGF